MRHGQQDYRRFMDDPDPPTTVWRHWTPVPGTDGRIMRAEPETRRDDLDPPTEEHDLPAIARASDIETCLSTDTARTDDTGFCDGGRL